jgi:hypothetical protein
VKTDELIERLVAEAEPVQPLADPDRRAAWWTAAALATTVLAVLYFGLRRDAAEVWRSPMVLARVALLGVTVWLAVTTAFRLSVPGGEPRVRARWWPVIALGALVALSTAEVLTGAVSGSMGSPLRSWMCVRKVAFAGAVPAILAVLLIRRAAPLEPRWTAFLGVLGAGAAGALTSEMACSIEAPVHTLLWHILPVAVFGVIGLGIGAVLWRRRAWSAGGRAGS